MWARVCLALIVPTFEELLSSWRFQCRCRVLSARSKLTGLRTEQTRSLDCRFRWCEVLSSVWSWDRIQFRLCCSLRENQTPHVTLIKLVPKYIQSQEGNNEATRLLPYCWSSGCDLKGVIPKPLLGWMIWTTKTSDVPIRHFSSWSFRGFIPEEVFSDPSQYQKEQELRNPIDNVKTSYRPNCVANDRPREHSQTASAFPAPQIAFPAPQICTQTHLWASSNFYKDAPIMLDFKRTILVCVKGTILYCSFA